MKMHPLESYMKATRSPAGLAAIQRYGAATARLIYGSINGLAFAGSIDGFQTWNGLVVCQSVELHRDLTNLFSLRTRGGRLFDSFFPQAPLQKQPPLPEERQASTFPRIVRYDPHLVPKCETLGNVCPSGYCCHPACASKYELIRASIPTASGSSGCYGWTLTLQMDGERLAQRRIVLLFDQLIVHSLIVPFLALRFM